MSKFSQLWQEFVALIEGDAKKIETAMAPEIQEIAKDATALVQQILTTIGSQAYAALKKALTVGVADLKAGDGRSKIVADAVAAAKADLPTQIEADGVNALYGAASIILADIDTPAAIPANADQPKAAS